MGCSAASLALGIAFAGAPAFAQTAPAAEEDAVIIVTGSRIPQPNLTGATPVTVMSSAEIKLQGTTRTEDLINSLPQAFAGQGGNIANGATGTATLNLRGLGEERTLVLINGRRLMPGDPTSSAADVNFIPSSLVKRVEVLTGGASSTYGSDAIAGVVNFVMDTDFEGFQIDSQYSLYQHNNNNSLLDAAHAPRGFAQPKGNTVNGGTIDVTATFGGKFGDDDQGHFTAYAGYRKLKAVTQSKYDYSSCASQVSAASAVSCGGSATSANGTFFDWASNTLQVGPGRTFIPGFTPYNFAPLNYFQRPDERYTAGVFADYEISPAFHPYMEAMFMDDRTVAQIAESGNFGNTLSVNCDNPLLSAQQKGLICGNGGLGVQNGNLVTRVTETGFPLVDDGSDPRFSSTPLTFFDPTTGNPYNKGFLQGLRRNVEGGPRRDDLQHTSFRIVGGMKGEISPVWSYDASYVFGRTNFTETYFNEFSARRLNNAVDVIVDPRTGQNACRVFVSGVDTNCRPYDMFALGGVTQEALNYVQVPGFQRGNTQERVFNANFTGALGEYGLKTPWSDQGLGINVGVEYRKESLELNTDINFQTGDLTGQGAATLPTKGSFDVKEVFGEFQLPIIDEGFVHRLAIEGGYRYSHYSSGVNTDTYKVVLDFAPIRDIRFRAGYNRAVRAPNVQDLFAPIRVALNGSSDPCTENPDGSVDATPAQCALTGVTPGNYPVAPNPAGQFNGLIGGNPNLQPESSDTKTLGVVFQPGFLPGFSATVDWFDIKVKNLIQPYGQDVIIDQCLNTGNPTFCSLIQRDPTGSLWRSSDGFIRDLDLNIGGLKTRGIDVTAAYSTRVPGGSLSLSMVGTWLDKLITDNGVSAPYDCAGLYGLVCGTPNPEWRHKARATYTMENGLGLSLQWRYFHSVTLDRTSSNTTLNGGFADFNRKLPAQSYFDLSATFAITDAYTFRLGVQNILDNDPPIIGANGSSSVVNACTAVLCSGNTFPNVYDAMGRYIYAGVTLNF
ncbi:TonB-dependent receptor [Sphingomonas sp. SRS2]|nr:TonB-dependent receptor [Sphingomonas sp. SRS2]